MTAHTHFYTLITALVSFKDRIKGESPLIDYLKSLEYDSQDWEKELPDNKELSEILGMPRLKINAELKQLYKQVLDKTWNNPIEIKDYHHTVSISVPIEERKRGRYAEDELTTQVHLKLPYTPHVGEKIDLTFIDSQTRYRRGYINEVVHAIHGDIQEIILYVHPTKNYVHKWDQMRRQNEWREKYHIR